METRNPWLKLKEEARDIQTPTRVLRKQAGLLDDATGGVIRGHVDSADNDRTATTVLEFSAVVPTLNNYEVVLFKVRHPVTQYPATLVPNWGGKRRPTECKDGEELEAAVVDYCTAPDLQKIVAGLFAQAHQALE